jgi:translation elongation factor EF-1alpha
MLNCNVTIIGDSATGKSMLIRRLTNYDGPEILENFNYPCKIAKSDDMQFSLNISKVRENLSHVPKTAEKVLMSDLIIYVMSLGEAENPLLASGFKVVAEKRLLQQKRVVEKDDMNKRLHFNDCKKRKPGKTQSELMKMAMKSPYDSFFQTLLQMAAFFEFEKKILVFVNKCEHDNYDTLNAQVESFKKGFDAYISRFHLNDSQISLVFGSLTTESNILTVNPDLIEQKTLFEEIYQKLKIGSTERPKQTLADYLPMRFSVSKSYKILGTGIVAVGYQLNDSLKPGDEVIIMPSMKTSTVKSIERYNESFEKTSKGGFFGVSLKGIQLDDVSKGSVICQKDQQSYKLDTNNFSILARLSLAYVHNKITKGMILTYVGYNTRIACSIEELVNSIDFESSSLVEENNVPVTGTQLIAVIRFHKPAYVEKYEELPELGRFMLVGSNIIVAYGQVENIIAGSTA